MASLKDVRIRIASVSSTKQITSAMKMVSASKLRRAQNAILKLRPYAAKLKEILQNLSSSLENEDGNTYSITREPNKVLLIVIASNRGLCGAFNSNVIKATNTLITTTYTEQLKKNNLSLICIGKKVSDFYSKHHYPLIAKHDSIYDSLTFDNATEIAEKIMKSFADKQFDKVEIIYNQFKNAVVQKVAIEQFLPIQKLSFDTAKTKPQHTDYIFEPNKELIVNELIPKSLKIQFYKALLDSHAAEHGARMTAMHKATDNATELLKDLRLLYNKTRQASITRELLEIVSGAEALKK